MSGFLNFENFLAGTLFLLPIVLFPQGKKKKGNEIADDDDDEIHLHKVERQKVE